MSPHASSPDARLSEGPENLSPGMSQIPLNPEEILPYLPSQGIGSVLEILDEISSTNTYLLSLPRDQCPHGMVAAAENQTAGKGRHGRRWLAPPYRNLSFSIVLRPKTNPGGLVTLAAAYATVQALRGLSIPAAIKWPNDVVESKSGLKLGGILCEARQEKDTTLRMVLGIGLNVNLEIGDFPEEIRDQATSLHLLLGHPFDRSVLLVSLLQSFGSVWSSLEKDGGETLVRESRPLCATLGCNLRLDMHGHTLEGIAVDLDPKGRLVLRLPSGVHQIIEIGEIRKSTKVD